MMCFSLPEILRFFITLILRLCNVFELDLHPGTSQQGCGGAGWWFLNRNKCDSNFNVL